MKKNILLATTGESPQVVTETLYALHDEGQPWPDEIFLITTTLGEARALVGLLEQGHLARLCDEIGKPMPGFDADHILVVPDANGQPVDDARSLEDHEALANFIMTTVRQHTAEDTQTVYASLAGGRKTMTFYMGYAMSLFGRRQDKLSHVLISKGYESLADFWYPSNCQGQLHGRDGEPLTTPAGAPLMPADASVTLASIPFVRHRQNLPPLLPQSGASVHFRDLVRLINLGELPEELRLRIDLPNQRIIVRDSESPLEFEFKPGLLALAFYAMMARATLRGESTLYRPSGEYAKATGTILRDALLRELLALCELPRKPMLEEEIQSLRGTFKDSTVDVLARSITASWFDQRKGDLRKAFEEKLPPSICRRLSPEIIWSEDGERLDEAGSTKGGGYGIPLPAGNIELIDCSAA